ncbi:MAG: nuclear transport factor 2 family protein [Planctomycetes bacterium]|nr:nuclear transport factor 2 family protein [Planctomycetota bacterium]
MRSRVFSLILVAGAGGCRAIEQADLMTAKTEVRVWADHLARDLERDGPEAWPRYFLDDPSFFMAVDGKVEFRDYAQAKTFCADFDARTASVNLSWESMRVEALDARHAVLASNYHERIISTSGKTESYSGYFTAVAVKTDAGWKLQHVHWSSPVPHP